MLRKVRILLCCSLSASLNAREWSVTNAGFTARYSCGLSLFKMKKKSVVGDNDEESGLYIVSLSLEYKLD